MVTSAPSSAPSSTPTTPTVDSLTLLTEMGIPREIAKYQLNLSQGDVQDAAEQVLHAAHGGDPAGDLWGDSDCPVCARHVNAVAIAEQRYQQQRVDHGFLHAVADVGKKVADKVKHRPHPEHHLVDNEHTVHVGPHGTDIGAMLRRPSILANIDRLVVPTPGAHLKLQE